MKYPDELYIKKNLQKASFYICMEEGERRWISPPQRLNIKRDELMTGLYAVPTRTWFDFGWTKICKSCTRVHQNTRRLNCLSATHAELNENLQIASANGRVNRHILIPVCWMHQYALFSFVVSVPCSNDPGICDISESTLADSSNATVI